MRRIGVAPAATAAHAPMPSSTRRLPPESAVVRASKLGWSSAPGATGSTTTTSSGRSRKRRSEREPDHAAAGDGHVAAQGLRRVHAAAISRSISSGSVGMPAVRTSGLPSVTTTSSSMRTPMPRHSRRTSLLPGGDVDAGLDGGDHARLQQSPLVADLVLADVVHVHAEPMPDAVHEEAAVSAVLDQFRHAPLQQAEAHEALRDGAHRRLVRLVPVRAGADLRDRGPLRLQHHLVDRPLPAAVAAADGKRARHVGGVIVELAARVDQQQFAVLHLAAVLAVMQHAGIRPAADDRVIGDVGAAAVELVQDLRHHLVLHAARLRCRRRRAGAPRRRSARSGAW